MFLLGRGSEISSACLAGIALVVAGCILLPMRHLTDLKGSHYLSRLFLAALLAALATTAYSIADEQALRLLVSGRLGSFSNLEASLVYFALWAISSSGLQAAAVAGPEGGANLFPGTDSPAVPDLRSPGTGYQSGLPAHPGRHDLEP